MYRPAEDEHPLSRDRRVLYFAMFILALLVCVFLIVKGRSIDVWVGVMTSFFVVSLVELIPDILKERRKKLKETGFRRLFGLPPNTEACLVFGHRTLDDDSVWKLFCQPPKIEDQIPVCEGTHAWLAEPDIRGAIYIANELFKMGCGANIIHDKDIVGNTARPELCVISIGLGFNCYTKWLTDEFDGHFFKIKFRKSLDPTFQKITDCFTVNDREPPANDGFDNAIVARIITPISDKKRRVSFVCAGRTAAGTAAAGYFLADSWPRLLDLYQKEGKDLQSDSLRVIVKHIGDARADQSHDSSGRIRNDGLWGHVWQKATSISDS